jgi:hypothetical protein
MGQEMGLVALGTGAVLAQKILGPTADWIGQGLLTWTQDRVENLKHIFANAETKLGDAINDEGSVPPRVLGLILDQGSYASDPVATEYFGGILASSRSGVSRDDRGATMAALVTRLSFYQLRTHYIIYSVAHNLFRGRDILVGFNASRQANAILIPHLQYMRAMKFEKGEDFEVLVAHALNGLEKEGLIDLFITGDETALAQVGIPNVPGPAFACVTSALGAELYLWAHGLSRTHINDFAKVTIERDTAALGIEIPSAASLVSELPPIPDEVKAAMQQLKSMAAQAMEAGHQFPSYSPGEDTKE